jgi:hypothetical protein
MDIHHKNGDYTDDSIENLEPVLHSVHTKMYHSPLGKYGVGFNDDTKEYKRRYYAANRKRMRAVKKKWYDENKIRVNDIINKRKRERLEKCEIYLRILRKQHNNCCNEENWLYELVKHTINTLRRKNV